MFRQSITFNRISCTKAIGSLNLRSGYHFRFFFLLFIVVKINSVAIYLSQTPRVSDPYVVPRTISIGVLKVRVCGGVGQRSDLPLDKFLVPLLSSLKGGIASVRGHAHDPKFPSCHLWFLLCPTPKPLPWGRVEGEACRVTAVDPGVRGRARHFNSTFPKERVCFKKVLLPKRKYR